MSLAIRTVHVRIEGRVQGVGFRAWTYRTARECGLRGWVRNRFDGSVEAVFQGPPEAVAEMLECCEVGPAAAGVTRVHVIDKDVGVFHDFDVRPTD